MHIIIFKKKNKYEFLKFFSIFVREISNICIKIINGYCDCEILKIHCRNF